MIEANNSLYPIHNIKEIRIDYEKLNLTIYFISSNIYPITLKFNSKEDLDKKVDEYLGRDDKNGKRKLFG